MTRRTNPAARLGYLALGWLFTGLGFVGAFLPLLPTVPFLVVAAACFARSSERLEAWLYNHRMFGPMLRSWRDKGAIPVRGKWAAVLGSGLGFVLFLTQGHSWWLIVPVAALVLAGMIYVVSRPSA